MRKLFIFLFFVIFLLSINQVYATISLSPGRAYFNVDGKGEVCETINLFSQDYDGTIIVRDVWASNIDEGTNINKYTSEKEDLGIDITYDNELEITKGEEVDFEVCILKDNKEKAKGAIIFTPSSDTNVVVEVGTWMYINMEKEVEEVIKAQEIQTQTTTSGGSGNSGSSVKATELSDAELKAEENALKAQEAKVSLVVKEVQEEDKSSGITGSFIGSDNSFTFNWNRILMGFIVAAIGIIAVVSFRKKYRRNY